MSHRWYDERPEPEKIHRGTLVARTPITSPGGRTRLMYELEDHDATSLPVYAPEMEEALAGSVGCDVEVIGKVIDLSSEGFSVELWLRPGPPAS